MARALELARLAALQGEVPVGAVLVREGRIAAARCYLTPPKDMPELDESQRQLGARHRAALGLSHERWNPWRRGIALAVAAVVVIGNISIPVAVLTGYVR